MKRLTDERQDHEIHKIEHVALWLLFWLLVISIPVQLLLFHDPMQLICEIIALVVVSLFVGISFLRRGLWGTYTTPTWRTHLLSGFLAAVIGTGVIWANIWGSEHIIFYLLTCFAGLFLVAFLLSFVLGVFVKRREKKLADENDNSDHDDSNAD